MNSSKNRVRVEVIFKFLSMFLNYGALNFKLHVHYLRRYLVLSSRHILCNTDKVCMYYVIFSF